MKNRSKSVRNKFGKHNDNDSGNNNNNNNNNDNDNNYKKSSSALSRLFGFRKVKKEYDKLLMAPNTRVRNDPRNNYIQSIIDTAVKDA